jgi:hypothetical protein
MKAKFLRPLLELTVLSLVALMVHFILFAVFFAGRAVDFHYSIAQLYGCFFGFSIFIVFVLIRIRQVSIDSVGNTFMLLTCIKMVAAYVLLRPILAGVHAETAFEKINFFIVFAVFLTIETIVTIRMLAQTQR